MSYIRWEHDDKQTLTTRMVPKLLIWTTFSQTFFVKTYQSKWHMYEYSNMDVPVKHCKNTPFLEFNLIKVSCGRMVGSSPKVWVEFVLDPKHISWWRYSPLKLALGRWTFPTCSAQCGMSSEYIISPWLVSCYEVSVKSVVWVVSI